MDLKPEEKQEILEQFERPRLDKVLERCATVSRC